MSNLSFNLEAYITANMPSPPTFTINGFKTTSPDPIIALNDDPGAAQPWIDRFDNQVQMMSRASNQLAAGNQITAVYNFITKRFGLILPQVIIDGDTYPEVITAQIIALQTPTWIGPDEKGLHLFSCNLKITTTSI